MQANSAALPAAPSPTEAAAPAWSVARIREIHDLPLPELLYRAQTVHRQHHRPEQVQLCTLLSVKTGGCAEDCSYCPQSSAHDAMDAERFLQVDEVLQSARAAKAAGATRFCMGAAWREIKDGPAFDRVLQMVGGVRELGMEACVTLGMLNEDQAQRLASAGLTAYNHNLDTSKSFYGNIITTRIVVTHVNGTLSTSINFDIPVRYQGEDLFDGRIFVGSMMTRLYADAGTTVRGWATRDSGVETARCAFAISGHTIVP